MCVGLLRIDMNERIENALSRERLDELKPDTEDLVKNTRRATIWYNAAVYTAASIFVEAAEESDEFKEAFMSKEAWREVMAEEIPELNERLMGIGLSAFQGGSAESVAREEIKE